MHRLFLLFVLVVLPLAANGDLQNVVCLGHGNHTANGNYEANIRRLAAILPAKTSSMPPGCSANHEAGKFPDGLYAVSRCHNGTGSSSCRACVVLALQEAQRACPYREEVVFFNGNCSLQLSALLSGPNIESLTFIMVNGPKGEFFMFSEFLFLMEFLFLELSNFD